MSQESTPSDAEQASEITDNNAEDLAQPIGKQALEATEIEIEDHLILGEK